MWTDKLKIGDLVNKRVEFKLHVDGQQGWLDEVKLRALYKLP